jgi:hypothetical protein
METESQRRKRVIAAGETDYARWRDANQLAPAWDRRAELAATLIPAGATVLDLGCGRMALEGMLAPGSRYLPCDLVARDERTQICDFNAGQWPEARGATHVSCLGVLEYMYRPQDFLAGLARYRLPVVLSYNLLELTPGVDRGSGGWVNHLDGPGLVALAEAAGFVVDARIDVPPREWLLRLVPRD